MVEKGRGDRREGKGKRGDEREVEMGKKAESKIGPSIPYLIQN